MPTFLQPAVARKLLLTAVTRQPEAETVQRMLGLAYLQQHVDAATLEAMLQQLVSRCAWPVLAGKFEGQSLCQLPAAAELTSEAVTRLLLVAMQSSDDVVISELCTLPALQQLSAAAVFQLLQVSVQHSSKLPDALYELPAVQHLSRKQVLQLLQAGATRGYIAAELLMIPAAAEISNVAMFQLLCANSNSESAFTVQLSELPPAFYELPAVQQLNSQQLLQLLQAAAEQGEVPADLCMLPAATDLSTEAALELLLSGVKYTDLPPAFYELPAVQQLSSQQLLQLLQGAGKQGKVPAELFMPPAAAELRSEAAMELMQSGVKYTDLPPAFYELPALQQLNNEQLLQLLRAGAIKRQVPYWLCKLPAMAGISNAALLQVVHTALVKQDTMYVQSMIAGFPGEWIESLTADTKFTLLLPAVKRMRSKGHILGLKDLAGALSAGQQLSSEHA
jgi:hypothetical protein